MDTKSCYQGEGVMESLNLANEFKEEARRFFGTVSGDAINGFRIAVTGKRMFQKVAALAEQYLGEVAADTGRYPQLMKITFKGQL